MTAAVFLSIVLIHLAAAISPGPSFVVAVRMAASEGFKVATALALGFGLGAVLWAAAAMLGLAIVFQLVPALFIGMKLLGAAFLFWIAYNMWKHAKDPLAEAQIGTEPRSLLSAVRFGFLTFATNPKPAVFFGAVFVGLVPMDTPLPWRLAILAAVFANETLWYIFVARVFSTSRARNTYMRLKAVVDRTFGGLMALLGLKIALT